MAHGVPCIGVRGEPMQEIIRHRTDGVLVAPGDVDQIASWTHRLLADTDLCRRWGVSARQQVEKRFTWRHVARRMLPAFDAAVTEGS
jgi:glycosyltransferase involved in cell wall biosynthesis